MTSTTSSNKKRFGSLFKWALGRNRAVIIAYSVLMIIGIVLDLYVVFRISVERYGINTQSNLGQIGYLSIFIAQMGAMLFTLISAVHTFSFLHNKRSTDMYGAIPVKRGTMYLTHLFGGITSVSIPFVGGSLIVVLFTCRDLGVFITDICFILFGILSIAAAYSFTALIACCCGTGRDTVIITISANAIYLGVVGIFYGAAASMLPGIYFNSVFNTPVLTFLAPYSFFGFLDGYYFSNQLTALFMLILWTVLFIGGMILLGLRCAKTRKAETAQNEFNIKWLPVVIKAGISVLCGGLAGFFAAGTSNTQFTNMFIFAFWYIGVGFAAFIILHLIFNRGFKGRLLPSLFAYCGTTAAALAVIFGMTTGLGIDTYVPTAANVSSVKLGDQLEFSSPENIETITEIHKLITEGVQKEYSRPYYIGNNYTSLYSVGGFVADYYDYYGSESLYRDYTLFSRMPKAIMYNKRIGLSTERRYNINHNSYKYYDCEKIEELLKKLYNSEEYKKQQNSSLWNGDAVRDGKLPEKIYATKVSFTYEDHNGTSESQQSFTLRTDEEYTNELYKCLREDILADNNYYNTVYLPDTFTDQDTSPAYYLYINVIYIDTKSNISSDNIIYLCIPYTYKNTISFLRNNGADV